MASNTSMIVGGGGAVGILTTFVILALRVGISNRGKVTKLEEGKVEWKHCHQVQLDTQKGITELKIQMTRVEDAVKNGGKP